MAQVQRQEDFCAVFVHAGAGYHSRENEPVHMDICAQAASTAMKFLRSGGSAVAGVEVALMVLENSATTNAGYGSNLTEQGRVEGDASIVDHFGRGGAVGAVPNIRNPISLARKVYERAHLTDDLSQVPPTLLVSEGACEFAWQNGIALVADESLISPNARARWTTWCKELAEFHKNDPRPARNQSTWHRSETALLNTYLARTAAVNNQGRSEAMMPATRQLGNDVFGPTRSDMARELDVPQPRSKWVNPRWMVPNVESSATSPNPDISPSADFVHASTTMDMLMRDTDTDTDTDEITDTIGAIVIDMHGNIAAGSSSGGIGMKRRGRIGLAALVGVGTHVISVDPTDPQKRTVAVVCSGTGEHIASTLAANTSATRLYHNQCKGEGGKFAKGTEEEVLRSVIIHEFVGHSAVRTSEVEGSIGIMSVKKNVDGIGLYFAHNTDSFALASMSSNDTQPSCLMSRNRGHRSVAQGGLMFRPKGNKKRRREKNSNSEE